jgi:hypothetical protein
VHYYHIDGYVTGSQGIVNPIPGVAIEISDYGPVLTTDANGHYRAEGVREGTHILTPTKASYIFFPPSKTIELDGDKDQVNFVGLNVATPTPTPACTPVPPIPPAPTPIGTLAPPFTIADESGDQIRAKAAFNLTANEYLVVWESGDNIYGRRLSVTGALGSLIAISTATSKQAEPVVAYNSSRNEYLVV